MSVCYTLLIPYLKLGLLFFIFVPGAMGQKCSIKCFLLHCRKKITMCHSVFFMRACNGACCI